MKKHSSKILRLAALMASRESGFIFAFLGVLVQMSHTWFIAYDLSSLPGVWRFMQAGVMAFFISAALLYFVLKSSDGNDPRARKWRKTVNMFAWLETCINLYYWGHKLLWAAWPDPDYGSFIIAVPFSFVIPLTLKAYSSEVRVEDFSEVEDIPEPNEDLHAYVEEIATSVCEQKDLISREQVSKLIDARYPGGSAYQNAASIMVHQQYMETPVIPAPTYTESIRTDEIPVPEETPNEEEQVEQISTEQTTEQQPVEQSFESTKSVTDILEERKELRQKHVEESVEESDEESEITAQSIEDSTEELIDPVPVEESTEETIEKELVEEQVEQTTTEQSIEEEPSTVDLPELGKAALDNILSSTKKEPQIVNGSYDTNPAYVKPSVDDSLFSYQK